jgi:hypothetical protein
LGNHDNKLEVIDVDIVFADQLQRDAVLDAGILDDAEPKLQTAGVAHRGKVVWITLDDKAYQLSPVVREVP